MQDRFPRERVSMPVPILLAITDFTRRQVPKCTVVYSSVRCAVTVTVGSSYCSKLCTGADWHAKPDPNPNPNPNPDPNFNPDPEPDPNQIGDAKAVTLTSAAGTPLAILRAPETYEYRAREVRY